MEFYEQLFDEFKLYFPWLTDNVDSWTSNGPNTILIKMFDGKEIEYNHNFKSIKNVVDYNGTEDDWRREFSNKLIEKMADKGFDQSYLSELSGVSQVSISKYINRKAMPSGFVIDRLAEALECSVSDLIDFR